MLYWNGLDVFLHHHNTHTGYFNDFTVLKLFTRISVLLTQVNRLQVKLLIRCFHNLPVQIQKGSFAEVPPYEHTPTSSNL